MIPKKVFYVPGLISLIGLPILLLLFGPEDPVGYGYHSLKLQLQSPEVDTSLIPAKDLTLDEVNKHKIIQIDLSQNSIIAFSNSTYDDDEAYFKNKKLQFIQNELERLQFTHDTTIVLKVTLGYNSSYSDFIWLLDQAMIYQYKYLYIDDDFYFLANVPPVVKKYPKINFESLSNDTVISESSKYTPPTKWEIFVKDLRYKYEEASYLIKGNWLLSISFLLLIILPSLYYLFKKKNIIISSKQLALK